MTNLQKLLAEHPAPWDWRDATDHEINNRMDVNCQMLVDANGRLVDARLDDFVELVNDYAARISAGERFISGGGDG